MKNLLILLFSILLISSNQTNAENINSEYVFANIENINTFKCTGNRISGSIKEYDNFTNEYTFKDGEIYSTNMHAKFGDITKNPKKVLRLKITDDYITFKERLMKFEGTYYAWSKINRKTGEYFLNAKNDYGYWFKRANAKGICTVEN